MAQLAQINFAKLPLELKEEADILGGEYSTKQEFLKALLEGYKESKQNKEKIELDVSKYKAVDTKSKTDVQHLFEHLMTVLDNNFMSIKTESLTFEKKKMDFENQKKEFEKEKKDLEILMAKTTQNHLEAQAIFENEIVELYENKEKEFKTLLIDAGDKYKKLESENKKLIDELKSINIEKEEILKNLDISRKLIKNVNEQDYRNIELTKQLSKKDSEIEELTKELSKKDRKLDRVEYRVENLEKDIKELMDESSLSNKTIRQQEIEIAVQEREILWLQKAKGEENV